eukprot:581236-Pyramimonas_sp.AAC.1
MGCRSEKNLKWSTVRPRAEAVLRDALTSASVVDRVLGAPGRFTPMPYIKPRAAKLSHVSVHGESIWQHDALSWG